MFNQYKTKRKRKRKPTPIPYYQWKISSLLVFGLCFVGWLSGLEVAYYAHIPSKLLLIAIVIGSWILGAWFMWIRADAQVYPPDPRVSH